MPENRAHLLKMENMFDTKKDEKGNVVLKEKKKEIKKQEITTGFSNFMIQLGFSV